MVEFNDRHFNGENRAIPIRHLATLLHHPKLVDLTYLEDIRAICARMCCRNHLDIPVPQFFITADGIRFVFMIERLRRD
jgi:hypothetical protein